MRRVITRDRVLLIEKTRDDAVGGQTLVFVETMCAGNASSVPSPMVQLHFMTKTQGSDAMHLSVTVDMMMVYTRCCLAQTIVRSPEMLQKREKEEGITRDKHAFSLGMEIRAARENILLVVSQCPSVFAGNWHRGVVF